MGIASSFNIGVTGLKAAGTSMNVIGDNIANAGTFGFKSSRAEFQDVLSRSLKGIDGGDQVGSGTKLGAIKQIWNQGNVTRTENITDLAINGDGFFVIDAKFGQGYSRDGSFHFDKEGYLVTNDGYQLKGWKADPISGKIQNNLESIRLNSATLPAQASKKINFSMNLDSRAKVKEFDPQNPDETSNYNNSLTVYDNVGNKHVMTMFYNKTENNKWQYRAMVDGKDAEGGEPGKWVEMASGTVEFNDKGQLLRETESSNSFNFAGGALQDQKIKMNWGNSIEEGGDGYAESTQYGYDSTVARHTQDGYRAATLASMSWDDKGLLSAVYDNGISRDIAQIAIHKFDNNGGLFKVGQNLFKGTISSGQGVTGKPGDDGRGDVVSKSIELSNVDIADEFVKLMESQRNFQANTRTITTADKMMQEVLNLKR